MNYFLLSPSLSSTKNVEERGANQYPEICDSVHSEQKPLEATPILRGFAASS
jgi:hypothetical protein